MYLNQIGIRDKERERVERERGGERECKEGGSFCVFLFFSSSSPAEDVSLDSAMADLESELSISSYIIVRCVRVVFVLCVWGGERERYVCFEANMTWKYDLMEVMCIKYGLKI